MFSTTNVFPSTKSTAAGHHFPHLITTQQDAGGQSSATAIGYPQLRGVQNYGKVTSPGSLRWLRGSASPPGSQRFALLHCISEVIRHLATPSIFWLHHLSSGYTIGLLTTPLDIWLTSDYTTGVVATPHHWISGGLLSTPLVLWLHHQTSDYTIGYLVDF